MYSKFGTVFKSNNNITPKVSGAHESRKDSEKGGGGTQGLQNIPRRNLYFSPCSPPKMIFSLSHEAQLFTAHALFSLYFASFPIIWPF